jgi:hypothetical protein
MLAAYDPDSDVPPCGSKGNTCSFPEALAKFPIKNGYLMPNQIQRLATSQTSPGAIQPSKSTLGPTAMPAWLRQCYDHNGVGADNPCLTGAMPVTQEQHAARFRCMLQEYIRDRGATDVLSFRADSGQAEMMESAASYCELSAVQ